MKVLLLSVRSDIGGGPKHIFDLLSNSNKAEVEFFIAAPGNGEFSSRFEDLGGGYHELPFRKFKILSFFKLLSFLRKNQISIVHSHGRGAGLYSRLLKLFGYKVIHTFHGIHIGEGLVGKIKLMMDKLLIPLTDKFICVSESEKRSAIDHGVTRESKTIVIQNGVKFYGKKEKTESSKILVGTLARFNHQKGLDILLNYLEMFFKNNDYNLEIHIAGDGEDFKKVKNDVFERKLDNKIKLLGPTSKPIDFLNTLDAYISFARFEGLPIAVLEAMSCGIPCLLSDVVGNKDIVEDGKNGMLFNLESYEDFKKKLEILIEDNALRSKFLENGLSTIQNRFSIDRMVENTYNCYGEFDV